MSLMLLLVECHACNVYGLKVAELEGAACWHKAMNNGATMNINEQYLRSVMTALVILITEMPHLVTWSIDLH